MDLQSIHTHHQNIKPKEASFIIIIIKWEKEASLSTVLFLFLINPYQFICNLFHGS